MDVRSFFGSLPTNSQGSSPETATRSFKNLDLLRRRAEFIEKANKKHNCKFDYTRVVYINAITKVEIICPAGHSFFQTPNHHLGGDGCRKCRGYYRTIADLIQLSNAMYGEGKFTFESAFEGMNKPIHILCSMGHRYTTSPSVHLRDNGGCKECANIKSANRMSDTPDEWLRKAKKTHGEDRYGYGKSNYRGQKEPVIITCPIHGDFEQNPTSHVQGCGCPKCGIEAAAKSKVLDDSEIRDIVTASIDVKYEVVRVFRTDGRIYVDIQCPIHGVTAHRYDHLRMGHVCDQCPVRHSKWSLEYLDYRSVRDGYIQHGGNEGEFRPPEMPRRPVDGYRAKYREITECQGSYHHGDPRVFSHADTYRGGDKTLGDVYRASCEKINNLRKAGYTVIEVWEYDWKRGKNAVVMIQRMFRAKARG